MDPRIVKTIRSIGWWLEGRELKSSPFVLLRISSRLAQVGNRFSTSKNRIASYIMIQDHLEGAVVFSRENPAQKLIVRRREDAIYYCKVLTDLRRDEVAFAAADLISLKLHNLDLVS